MINRLSDENKKLFMDIVGELCENGKVLSMDNLKQHGNTTCLMHSLAVAYYSLLFVDKYNIKCDKRSLVRGAVLHDYFLYDWHEKDDSHRLHGFTHPRTALRNACADWTLTDREQNIILRHMFPLTPVPPACREGWLVCLADKLCAVQEMVTTRTARLRPRRAAA